MTPGVAFFYGGLVKAKSVVSMMMMSFGALGARQRAVDALRLHDVVHVGHDSVIPRRSLGNPFTDVGLSPQLTSSDGGPDLHALAFAAFQATFAIITVALISGAIADRAKFGAWMIFAGHLGRPSSTSRSRAGSSTSPPDAQRSRPTAAGSSSAWAVIDFAGGTAVHINAGAAGLALALVLGKRVGFQKGMRTSRTTCR